MLVGRFATPRERSSLGRGSPADTSKKEYLEKQVFHVSFSDVPQNLRTRKISVAMRLGATPVPIPNTMVKTQAADGTALVTVWESRWLPNFKENKRAYSSAG